MLSVVMLSTAMLSIIMLSVIVQSHSGTDVVLSGVMLSISYAEFHYSECGCCTVVMLSVINC